MSSIELGYVTIAEVGILVINAVLPLPRMNVITINLG
jgi:hypothetical protein